jgi:sigma-B regulation protein RsbU (phosphoserine phosphatase)
VANPARESVTGSGRLRESHVSELARVKSLLGECTLSSSRSCLLGTVISGLGFGAVFSGTLRTVLPLAKADDRTGPQDRFFVCYADVISRGSHLTDPVAAVLRGEIADIVAGSVFLFIGFAGCSIAAIRRRAGVRIFVWLGVWSAMYGVLRLSQSPPVITASPRALQIAAPYINTAIGYLIIVPALLAFLELTLGKLRAFIQVAAWIGLAVGASGILVFVVTSAGSALMPYNNLLAACVLLILMSVVAVPRLSSRYLVFHDRGVLAVGTFGFAAEALYENIARPIGFKPFPVLDHIGFALLLFALAYAALKLVFANERRLLAVESELAIAHNIQIAILPPEVPSTRNLRVSAAYRPMTAVAGDFYEFVPVGDARVGILVADVAGHGVPAALIASMIKVAMQSVASTAHDPEAVLVGLNRVFSGQRPSQLISAAYLWLDTENTTARYSAAGHPPLLRWTHGQLDRIESNGFLLGMTQNGAYPVATMAIEAGERFLLYTDGVIDVENGRGEFFGDSKLEEVLRANQSRSPCELSEELLSQVNRWRPSSTPQQDDMTLVVIDVA